MRILGVKPGHDGAFALLEDGTLRYSLEAEKNSFLRFAPISPTNLIDAASLCDGLPDCIALGGWPKMADRTDIAVGAGYFGVGPQHVQSREISFFGGRTTLFEGTHESSHVWGSYGLSPFADRFPCYALVWEGRLGRFYRLDEGGLVTAYPSVMEDPGAKYVFLFMLADPSYVDGAVPFRFDDAGKMMALAAYGRNHAPSAAERRLIDWVLSHPDIVGGGAKAALSDSPFHDAGLASQAFHALASAHSDAILDRFMSWASSNLERGLPVVIGGGCGLNCAWNSAWAASGLFSDVFVPPCTNDSGSAIGTAIQAQHRLTGRAKVTWDVYCGSPPRNRREELRASGLDVEPAQVGLIAEDLAGGQIVAVMRGRCEIGPRALGARSLLADPRDPAMLDRLNTIKQRESYRPIAPVCLAEAADAFFEMPVEDRFMLYFSKVRDPRIPAVTHVDGSSRVQVVRKAENAFLWRLVEAFGAATGVPVLCNTSLNRKGRGFIDEVADLVDFCRAHGIRRAVCDDEYLRL